MFKKLQGMTHGQVLRSPINPAGTSERPDVKNPNSTVDVQPGGANPTGQLQPVASNSGLPIELPSGGLSPLPEHVSSSLPLPIDLTAYQAQDDGESASSPQHVSNSTVVKTVDVFFLGTSVSLAAFCGIGLLSGRKVDDKMIDKMLKAVMFFSLVNAGKFLYSQETRQRPTYDIPLRTDPT